MGARWYNPGDGDFTSADTVSVSPDPDPAAGNPFAYAADEPLDLVDPTGHYIVPPGGPDGAGTSERIGNGVTSPNNWIADVATARVVEHAVITAPNAAAKAAAAHAAVARVEAEQATARKAAVAAAARAKAAARAAAAAKAARAAAVKKTAEQVAARKAAAQRAAAARAPASAPGCSPRMLNYGACPSESGAAGTTAAQVKQSFVGAAWIIGSLIPIPGLEELSASEAAADIAAASDAAEAAEAEKAATSADDSVTQDDPPCPGGSSFTLGTLVLLASGKAVPINSLKPGDKVVASDTRTGKNQPETVTAVLVHHDTDLYNLTVKTSHGTQVIHTTSNHLFWDPYLDHGWIPAKQLKPGMHLKTPDGQPAVVVGGSVPAVHDGWMWDLTVPGNNDHDFYVVALPGSGGKADARYPLTDDAVVLVHNATPEQKCTLTLGPGPYAKSGVALVDGNIDGPGVRELINESGEANGCHSCERLLLGWGRALGCRIISPPLDC